MKHDYGDIRRYMGKDLAKTHHSLAKPLDEGERAAIADDLRTIEAQGFVVYENVLAREEIDAINEALAPLYGAPGRTGIEGFATRRIYSVLAKTRACDRLVDDPRVVLLLRALMAPSCLLSQLQAIAIDPGEKAQPIHTDDMIYPGSRPRAPLSTATVWALDDFTPENGATVAIAGSHLWDDEVLTEAHVRAPICMPAGSVVFFLGTLWHGGGANRSAAVRRAVSAQYCQPWLRTQENLALGTPREIVRELSPEIQSMLGYSLHPPFMGMVDGLHPKRLLED